MATRTLTASRMAFREQRRRPLLIVMLVALPLYFISYAIAVTKPIPRLIGLPNQQMVETTMKGVHGAVMAAITVGFIAGLCGVYVIQSALEADRRLVVAGFRRREAVVSRLLVLFAATALVLVVSLTVTAFSFTPRSWAWFAAGTALTGLIFGSLGVLGGVLLGKLGATYFIFFLAMVDLGVIQNPMFGTGSPARWATLFPGYGPMRVIADAAFASGFHAWADVASALVWTAALLVTASLVLRRSLGAADNEVS
jgi:hypothetical protein